MPEYTFQDLNGNKRVFTYPMKLCPAVGSQVIVNGKRYVRVTDYDSQYVGTTADRHVVSRSLPRNYIHHKNSGGKFDNAGRPLFGTKKQIRETTARSQGEGDQGGYAYD